MCCVQITKDDYGRNMLRKPSFYNALTNNTLNKNIAPFKQAKIGIVYINFYVLKMDLAVISKLHKRYVPVLQGRPKNYRSLVPEYL